MEKLAALQNLNYVICELENNGFYNEANELHTLYIKLAANKPWYKNPAILAPAMMGSMILPVRNLVDYAQNRDLYTATEQLESYSRRDQSKIVLLWKKFLNSKQETGSSFLPMNDVFDNITQIRTNAFAEENNLPYTPNQFDRQLFIETYKKFPDDQFLNAILKIIDDTSKSRYLLPSEEPFSTDILSQLEPESREEYLRRYNKIPKKTIEEKISTPKIETEEIKPKVKKIKKENNYGVLESAKEGLPWDSSDIEVYKVFARLRNKYEGGISTDPHDTGNLNPNNVPNGGGTKYGITQRNWDGYSMRHNLPLSPVMEISREQAEKVGFEDYKRSGAQVLPANTQLAVADYHFNSGPGNLIIALREVLGLPPIQVQGLKRADLIKLVAKQKKILYPMINARIKNQEQDEAFARKIYSLRVKLLAGSKTKKKKKQLVHNRGLLNRIDEMAQVTGNSSILDEISEQMKDMSDKERLELLRKYNLNRSRYFPPGYGNTAYDAKFRENLNDKS